MHKECKCHQATALPKVPLWDWFLSTVSLSILPLQSYSFPCIKSANVTKPLPEVPLWDWFLCTISLSFLPLQSYLFPCIKSVNVTKPLPEVLDNAEDPMYCNTDRHKCKYATTDFESKAGLQKLAVLMILIRYTCI